MFVYLGVFFALAASAIGNNRSQHIFFFFISGLFLIWFMGFRYETGCDYYGYYNRWLNFSPPTNINALFEGNEAGFAFLIWIVKALGLEYTWLNVFASTILVACYIKFATAHRFAPLILALLFPVIIIQLGMSGIRQALAGGFLMLACTTFVRKEKLWTALWILVGMQFHASVIIFVPIAFLAGEQVSTIRLSMAILVLGPVVSLLLADRFDTYESRYFEGTITSGGAIVRYALVLLPALFFVIYQKKVQRFYPEVFPLLKLGVLIILSLAPLVVLSSIALHRLNYYVMPLSILLCVYVGSILARKPSQGHLLAVLAYGTYSLFWFLSSRHAQICYVPYENTWFL